MSLDLSRSFNFKIRSSAKLTNMQILEYRVFFLGGGVLCSILISFETPKHHFHSIASDSDLPKAVAADRPLSPGITRDISASHMICGDNNEADVSKCMSSCKELPKEHDGERPISLPFIVRQYRL